MTDLFKNVIQKMCIKTVEVDDSFLELIPDQYRMWDMYNRAVKAHPRQLCS